MSDAQAAAMIVGGQKLSAIVNYMQLQQSAWNEELKRHYVVEEQQRAATQHLVDIAKADSLESMMNNEFILWLAKRDPQAASVADAVATASDHHDTFDKDWFHNEPLAARTGFVAVVPYPRGLNKESEQAVAATIDALGLAQYYIQSVPVHLPIRHFSRAVVRSPAHVPTEQHMSKSDRGVDFAYMNTPCRSGAEGVSLVRTSPILGEAVRELPCLWLSRSPTLVAICARCYVVQDICGAVEVACDQRWAGLLSSAKGTCAVSNAIQSYLQTLVRECLPDHRSWCVTLIGDVLKPDTVADATGALLTNASFSFRLVGLERADPARFELFDTEELSTIGGYLKRRHTNTGAELPPAVRYTHMVGTDAADGIAVAQLAGFPGSEVTRELQQSERAYRLQPATAPHTMSEAAPTGALAADSSAAARRGSHADPHISGPPM